MTFVCGGAPCAARPTPARSCSRFDRSDDRIRSQFGASVRDAAPAGSVARKGGRGMPATSRRRPSVGVDRANDARKGADTGFDRTLRARPALDWETRGNSPRNPGGIASSSLSCSDRTTHRGGGGVPGCRRRWSPSSASWRDAGPNHGMPSARTGRLLDALRRPGGRRRAGGWAHRAGPVGATTPRGHDRIAPSSAPSRATCEPPPAAIVRGSAS